MTLVTASWVDSTSSSYQRSGLRYTPDSDDASIIGDDESNTDKPSDKAIESDQESLDNPNTPVIEAPEQPRSASENDESSSTSGPSEVRDDTNDIDNPPSIIRVLDKRLGKLRQQILSTAFDDSLTERGCRFCACFAPLVVHVGSSHKPSIRTWASFRDACDLDTLGDNAAEIPIRYIENTISVLKNLLLEDIGMTKDETKEMRRLINLYKSRIPEYRKGRPSRIESLIMSGNRCNGKKKRTDTAYNPTGHMYHHISRTLKMKMKMKKERD